MGRAEAAADADGAGKLIGLPAPPPLGVYDRCPRCRQPCDLDVPCPNCGDAPLPEVLAVRVRRAAVLDRSDGGEEVNGHVFFASEDSCSFCGASLERAYGRRCGT